MTLAGPFCATLGLRQILLQAPLNDLEVEIYIENFTVVDKSFLNSKEPTKREYILGCMPKGGRPGC